MQISAQERITHPFLSIYLFIYLDFNYSHISSLKLAKMENNKVNNELIKLIDPGQKKSNMNYNDRHTKLQHQNENNNMGPKGSLSCNRLLEVD